MSTYPPRACGIAVFSNDLRNAMLEADSSVEVEVVAMVREAGSAISPHVVGTIQQGIADDYAAAAADLNRRGVDAVMIEHEFGIFGGETGCHVVRLAEALTVPVVVTLHTVLAEPSEAQSRTLRALCDRADRVMVFTETARRMVVSQGLADPNRVRVVPHGAPDVLSETAWGDHGSDEPLPDLLTIGDETFAVQPAQTVISTFGLISASKGLEVAIRALPAITAAHPEVLYLVAGQTHPDVIDHEGESYRLGLASLVRDLGLDQQVRFLDRFLTIDELARLLRRTDLYLTPYRSREQIVSGALTFAVAAGCPVVSTPYFYAEDLLATGAGRLVPFGDERALADAVLDLLDAPQSLAAARAEARRVGAELTWSSVGKATLAVLAEAAADRSPGTGRDRLSLSATSDVRPDHLMRLVDDVGIVQHAEGRQPDLSTGYCVDDVARLAIVSIGLERVLGDPSFARIRNRSVSFLCRAWDRDSALMYNFLDRHQRWLDRPHDGDHLGRAVWALGVAGCLDRMPEMRGTLCRSSSPREVAFAILGLTRTDLSTLPAPLRDTLTSLAGRLAGWFDRGRKPGWVWFENVLAYDNARLPQALIAAGRRLGDLALLCRGLEALDWYAAKCGVDAESIRLVGNRWRYASEPTPSWAEEGDEQPLDAAALVEALVEAQVATGEDRYGRQAVCAFEWFLGRNQLGVPVYDAASGGCHDGLGPSGLNANEGAESTLAYLQAALALDEAGLRSVSTRPA